MFLNLLMLIVMYPMMLIVSFVMYTSMKPKKGMVFGSTVSVVRREDETVKEVERQWSKEMKRNMLIGAFLPLFSFLVPYTSVQISIWTLWCFVQIALMEYPFVRANARIKELKRDRGWYNPEKPEAYIELKAAGEIRRVKKGIFAIPLVFSLFAAAAVYGLAFAGNGILENAEYVKRFGIVILLFALCNLLFLQAALWMDRQKTEVISTQSDVNLNYARARKNIWKDFWLVSSWLTTVYVWGCALSLLFDLQFAAAVLAGSAMYSAALAALLIPTVKRLRKVEAHYEKKRDIAVDEEDDRYWIGGVLYYNPSDRHGMVNMRNGLGTTLNLATRSGKIWAAAGGLAILSVPLLLGWLLFEEFTPISLSVSDGIVKAEHLRVEYELKAEEMKSAELVGELPEMSKAVGTAMDTLCKGTFYVYNEGNVKVFLNPENTVFIRIETAEDTYYVSGATDAQTRAVYEEIEWN